jgi:hypothetical protein
MHQQDSYTPHTQKIYSAKSKSIMKDTNSSLARKKRSLNSGYNDIQAVREKFYPQPMRASHEVSYLQRGSQMSKTESKMLDTSQM